MADTEKVIDSYERHDSGNQQVRVALSTFKNQEYFSLRAWYRDDKGELRPGKNGINLPVDEWPKVKALLDALNEELRVVESD